MSIDLTNLDITTPMAKPNGSTAWTISGNEALSKAPKYIYSTKEGIVMYAPVFGAATSSVHRTRCEWKESTPWKLQSQGFHSNYQKFTLQEINDAKSVVVSQTHDDNSNNPLCKIFIQRNKNKILSVMAGIRTTRTSADPVKEDIFVDFDMTKEVSIKQELDSEKMTLTITVSQDQRIEEKVWNLKESWNDTELVFHGGVYNQLNMGSSDYGTSSKLLITELEIKHFDGIKLDLYLETQKKLDEIKSQYVKDLKEIQSKAKTSLNDLTSEMKALTDKEKTAPLYLEILGFKTSMKNSLEI